MEEAKLSGIIAQGKGFSYMMILFHENRNTREWNSSK